MRGRTRDARRDEIALHVPGVDNVQPADVLPIQTSTAVGNQPNLPERRPPREELVREEHVSRTHELPTSIQN